MDPFVTSSHIHRFWAEEKFSCWKQLRDFAETKLQERDKWSFRGHSDASWKLESTLERTAVRLALGFGDLLTIEKGLMRRFQRYMYRYQDDVPFENLDFGELLATMQHFGAPTRLLDWTYSFYIALFFAVESAVVDRPFAIWAMDHTRLRNNAIKLMTPRQRELVSHDRSLKNGDALEEVFQRAPATTMVYPFNPFRQTSRHIIQQGTFTIPGDISKPFIFNLGNTLYQDGNRALTKIIVQFNKTSLTEVMYHLYRLNITRESLFPGLDGFARAMDMYVNIDVARPLDPESRRANAGRPPRPDLA